ncbi:hypothetical protein UlMin_030597 [Ulmus minor]
MSSRRGGAKPFTPGSADTKGKNVPDASRSNVEQLSQGVSDMRLEQDGGDWEEVIARKPKNRAGSSTARQWGQNPNGRSWGQSDGAQKLGVQNIGGPGRGSGNNWSRPAAGGNVRPQSNNRVSGNSYGTPQSVIPPPLEHGWNWKSKAGSGQYKGNGYPPFDGVEADQENDIEDEESDDEETDDELLYSDEFDSDTSQKSFGTRKKNRWFEKFFKIIDELDIDAISDPTRQWHCPACQGGPGAIEWFKGLQPLMTHAKTKGAYRVKLHRELAELLELELQNKGTSVGLAGEAFGRWKGLKDEEKDHDIVWPPMVVIMNTKLEKDANEKWIGMGNQELVDYFSNYAAVKARHSYGPQGHRGMSLLIFEGTATGYLEAERLHKHFSGQGTDRNAWNRPHRVLFLPGGERQLYGFLAVKEDLDVFNQHCQGKTKLKYELRSYQEMVVNQLRQMSEDNQKLTYYKKEYANVKMENKTISMSLGKVSEKYRKTKEENQIVRQRTKSAHEENREEMYLQEEFFKDQIKILHESRDSKEHDFERLQKEEREKVKQSKVNPSERGKKIDEFINLQNKEMEEFAEKRDALTKAHEEKMSEVQRKHMEEVLQLEEEFTANLTRLMEEYSPEHLKEIANN